MTNLKKLIAPACAAAPFPVLAMIDGGSVPLNSAAANLSEYDLNSGRFKRLDDDVALFLPDNDPHADDMFRTLEWLYALCEIADEDASKCAAEHLERPMRSIADIPPAAAHLLRCVSQTVVLLRLIARREEPQDEQCGVEPLFRKLVLEAKNSLADVGAQIDSHIDINANTACLTSHENLEAAFRHSLSAALILAKDSRLRIEINGDSFGLRVLLTFYSDVPEVDFDRLRAIPRPGEGDLSYAILGEVIHICGGSFRYANTDAVGELLLTLCPVILLDDSVYFFNEFTPLDESRVSAFCLEYADVFNEKRPRA